ncbi:MAG: InlB B-repeat-containing protein [Dehalococcoidia bacterium]|nr:InlB B-repeat-containing protein [Dehalococcoidia bacterium]
MTGGKISENTAEYGGGVGTFGYFDAPIFSITGGEISRNIAYYDGGGIYTDAQGYFNLSVAAGVMFANNKASTAYDRQAYDDALYNAKIGNNGNGVVWTVPFTQGYNNYDISYSFRGAPLLLDIRFMQNHYDNDNNIITTKNIAPYSVIGETMPINPSRQGYIFVGWNTSRDGHGTTFTGFESFSVVFDRAFTLYAQWLEDGNFTVTYQPGTYGIFTPHTAYNLYLNNPTTPPPDTAGQPGWKFVGWAPTPSSTITDNATYVAQWEQIVATIAFDMNTSNADFIGPAQDTLSVVFGDTYGRLPDISRAGYTFNGWFLEPTCVNEVIPSSIMNSSNDHTLYAKWTQITTWNLLNLVLCSIGALLVVLAIIYTFFQKNRGISYIWLMVSAILCILSAAIFLFTNRFGNMVITANKWVFVCAVILIIEIFCMPFVFRRIKTKA